MASSDVDFALRSRKGGHSTFQTSFSAEGDTHNNEDNDVIKKARPKRESAYSIQNIGWVIGSAMVFYMTDFPIAVLYDPRVHRTWFNVGALLISVNILICLFLIVWLSYIRKISSDDWETHYPAAIPIATASFVFGSFCVIVGLWPVWGIFTPVILFTLFMGFVVVITLLPNF